MSGVCQDDSLQMLCDWDISEKAFEMFNFFKTSKTSITFRVGVADLLTNLSGAMQDDTIEIFLNDSPTFVGLSYCDTGRKVGIFVGLSYCDTGRKVGNIFWFLGGEYARSCKY